MARWRETRGYTLELARDGSNHRWVRLGLVEQRGLLGRSFNVREARAERDAGTPERPRDLGAGRMLSWRWVAQPEASDLLSSRLQTLEALGYAVVEAQTRDRGAWDWLRELVHRQLVGHEDVQNDPPPEPVRDASKPPARAPDSQDVAAAIEQALSLGHDALSTIEGVAAVLEVDAESLRDPDDDILRSANLDHLGILLPHLCRHSNPAIRETGRRWLLGGNVRFDLDRVLVERWLRDEPRIAELLAGRMDGEGLALVGPQGIGRLARHSKNPEVRKAALAWQRRLEARVRAPG